MLAPAEAAHAFRFDNSYARLPERFFARLSPTPVAAPSLVRLNEELARQLGLDPAWLSAPEGVAILAGNTVPKPGEPLAMAYAGHQFGHFVPQLGDGRALLLGEVIGLDGVRRDIQLKGSGPTPFSRNGDGRAALGPVLREYIISEAMHALGIPTTRSLAVVTTGETVRREIPLPGAVLTRVASSHNKAEQGLRLVASRKHVDLPSETNADDHAEIAQLHSLPAGGQFDTQYVNNVIRDGDRMIVLYEAARNESIDPDIRQYADTMLPTLRDNRNQAQALVDQRLGN